MFHWSLGTQQLLKVLRLDWKCRCPRLAIRGQCSCPKPGQPGLGQRAVLKKNRDIVNTKWFLSPSLDHTQTPGLQIVESRDEVWCYQGTFRWGTGGVQILLSVYKSSAKSSTTPIHETLQVFPGSYWWMQPYIWDVPKKYFAHASFSTLVLICKVCQLPKKIQKNTKNPSPPCGQALKKGKTPGWWYLDLLGTRGENKRLRPD